MIVSRNSSRKVQSLRKFRTVGLEICLCVCACVVCKFWVINISEEDLLSDHFVLLISSKILSHWFHKLGLNIDIFYPKHIYVFLKTMSSCLCRSIRNDNSLFNKGNKLNWMKWHCWTFLKCLSIFPIIWYLNLLTENYVLPIKQHTGESSHLIICLLTTSSLAYLLCLVIKISHYFTDRVISWLFFYVLIDQ